jgi:hypothetical protein
VDQRELRGQEPVIETLKRVHPGHIRRGNGGGFSGGLSVLVWGKRMNFEDFFCSGFLFRKKYYFRSSLDH